jgi:S1-C subfamily serine protease
LTALVFRTFEELNFMEVKTEALSTAQSGQWQVRWQNMRGKAKKLVPFSAGIFAALLGLWAYNLLHPAPEPLTLKQVNAAVAEAMASATPAPAYSVQVFRIIQPSLVLIKSAGQVEGGEEMNGLGSGVVISDQGEILTALHVVDGAADIQVFFADGTQSRAQVTATQPENDIAVLRPDRLPDVLVPAVLGNPGAMQVGDEAYAVGNPFGLYGSMSAGVISGFNRLFQAEESDQQIEGLIQIDTAVNPGNSGGPLLNRYGQVIGIVIGILNPTDDEFFVGIGFAVPITTAGGVAGAPQY